MPIRRRILPRLRALLRAYPAVALSGPRQAGKTTLAREISPLYYDLEQEADRLRLDLEWGRVEASKEPVVLDEAQAHPAVFPRLRGAIDRDRKRNGRFLILGSVSPVLMRQVSESLAGRLGLCELTPFLLPEIPRPSLDRLWLCGGFPDGGVRRPSRFPDWQGSYLQLLAQRDLPQWGLPAGPTVAQRFLRMTAAAHAQIWNASQVGAGMGLSYHTVNAYLDFLEAAFLVRRLRPFSGSLRKRLIRSPRVYWRDSGLLHSLLGVTNARDLLTRPWVGASWEGFAIEQTLGWLSSRGRAVDACYLRTSDGIEVDLVLEFGSERWAVEIKLTSSPGPDDAARLIRAADLIDATRRVLLTRTSRPAESAGTLSTNLPDFLRRLG